MGVVFAVKKWRPYLLRRHFKVQTDQYSLKYLIEKHIETPLQQKWISKLLGNNFEVECKQENLNVVADALSKKENRSV